jgi:TonB family protein
MNQTTVLLYTPADIVTKPLLLPGRSGGGGGGGKHQLTPPSLGPLPRAADKQLVPPDPEPPKNLNPELVVDSTIVAPQLAQLRSAPLLNFGDPNGVVGPPSSGPGDDGGIGVGHGHGVGPGDGPGAGPGKNGGNGGGPYGARGGMIRPVLIYRVEPEYSEEARKAHYEGVVILEAIIRKNGIVDAINIVRKLGLGLDQNAIDAVKKWRFKPATKDGTPVDSSIRFEVSFNLR